jgi:hypothetical protein
MRSAAFSRIAACIVVIGCSLVSITSVAQSCKCPRNPGPGGGVQCSKDQIAICDPSLGECNCTCDSVQPGKTKADYEAQIFSKVLNTKIDPADLSSPQNRTFVSSFRKSREAKGTFNFDKEEGPAGRQQSQERVKVGVPEWLEEVLSSKGGVSVGPGASLQNCPNGICIGGENRGTATVNNYAPPSRLLDDEHAKKFKATLMGSGGTVAVFPDGTDQDVIPLAKQICDLFRDTKVWSMNCVDVPGYSTRMSVSLPSELIGLHCFMADGEVRKAFQESGLDCIYENRKFSSDGMVLGFLTILVGNAGK